jgi:hypothetical protein
LTANLTIIEDALREINVISEIDNASSEQGSFCLRRLNQMMEVWREDGVEIGYFAQSTTTDDIPIPDWAELGVTAALAIAIAPTYSASVSPELIANVSVSSTMITRKSLAERQQGANMSHLPAGSGNFFRSRNILTDS